MIVDGNSNGNSNNEVNVLAVVLLKNSMVSDNRHRHNH